MRYVDVHGSKYHMRSNCDTILREYQPATIVMQLSDLPNTPYAQYKRCGWCYNLDPMGFEMFVELVDCIVWQDGGEG